MAGKKRYNLVIREENMARIDAYVTAKGISRSAFVEQACLAYIDAERVKGPLLDALASLGAFALSAKDGVATPEGLKAVQAQYDAIRKEVPRLSE